MKRVIYLFALTFIVISFAAQAGTRPDAPPVSSLDQQLQALIDARDAICGNLSRTQFNPLKPGGPPIDELEKLIAGEDGDGNDDPGVGGGGANGKQNSTSKQTKQTNAEWAAYTQPELIEAVALAEVNAMRPLFFYTADLDTVFSASNLEAIATEMATESATFAANVERISNFLLFIQAAYYEDFYQPTISFGPSTNTLVKGALVTVANRPEFDDTAFRFDSMRSQFMVSAGNADASIDLLGPYETLVNRYVNSLTLRQNPYERNTMYGILGNLMTGISDNAGQGAASPWYNAITAQFAGSLGALATDPNYYVPSEYVVDNAEWLFAYFIYLNPAIRDLGHQTLSDAFNLYSHYKSPFIWAVQAMQVSYATKLKDGTPIDVNAIKAELTPYLFPNTFQYDNGAITFRTPIGKGKTKLLYDAVQEVESQFFRLCRNVTAVPGDQNPVISCYVYGSPAQYQDYQTFMFGTGTNNGGIYIEQSGNFYTYDRTTAQSTYTIEELFRHEYTHYLDGKYQVTGEFGDPGSMYDNSRITWYQEGFAELCAGATRIQGVLPRGKYIDYIAYDGADRMPLTELIGISYSSPKGFKFYRYAYSFLLYLLESDPQSLMNLLTLVRNNDKPGVDALWNTFKTNPTYQTGWDAFLDNIIAARAAESRTFKEDVPTVRPPKHLPGANANELYSDILAVGAATTPAFDVVDERFIFSAFLTLPIGQTASLVPHLVRQAFVNQLDARLNALEDDAPNFTAATAWFGGVTTNGNNATASIYIEAPYCTNGCDVKIWYVDKANAGNVNQDGQTWATAFSNIQAGIDAAYAAGGDEVWVAQGLYDEPRNYAPEGLGANTGTLLIRDGIALYGGFAGTETARDQRKLWDQQAIIDGTTSRSGSKAYHTVQLQEETAIDNFIVTGGDAHGIENREQTGGGIYINGVDDTTIANCYISGNKGKYGGAGIGVAVGSPNIWNCYIVNNQNDSYGGAIYLYYGDADIRNCIMANNYAYGGGGLFHDAGGNATYYNCVVYNNTAAYGALYQTSNAHPHFINSIIWDANTTELSNNYGGEPVFDYCDVRGGYAGTGNINSDPLFVNPASDDYHLKFNSPCRDTGTNTDAPKADIFGNPRPMDGYSDMGALEYPGTLPDPEGETPIDDGYLTCDLNHDFVVQLAELLRVIQFYNSFAYHCEDGTEDGYAPGLGLDYSCEPYDTDYNIQDWVINLAELVRAIQMYNSFHYHFCPADGTEDGFCPGL